jgi:hypothetical protein
MLTGPTWHKRQRTGPARSSAEEQEAEAQADTILKASRHWARCAADKTDGCMAEGLRCNLWMRAHSPGTVSLTLTKGWARLSFAKRGNLGIAMQDLAWTADSRLPEPPMLTMHPILHYLPNKLVHFILDYFPNWVASLQLPPSDGRHRQLESGQFHSVLERLANMPEVTCPLQLFSCVAINHRDWLGQQTIHAMPFEREDPHMVIFHVCMLSLIQAYTYIPIHTCTMPIHAYTCIYI